MMKPEVSVTKLDMITVSVDSRGMATRPRARGMFNANNKTGSMIWQFAVVGTSAHPYKISNLVRG